MKSIYIRVHCWLKPQPGLIKIVGAFCALLMVLSTARAQFTWPVYEPFSEYTNTPLDLGENETSNYWNFGNGYNGVNSYVITNAAALSFPALFPDPYSTNPMGVQEVPINTTSADRAAYFSPQTATNVYVSFLLDYQNNGGATADRCAFSLITGGTSTINGGVEGQVFTALWLTPDYRLQVTKNYQSDPTAFSAATPVLSTNVTHLIVMRYMPVPGGSDEVDLWVDPTPFGNNGSIPPPTISTTTGPNISTFDSMLLSNRKLLNGVYYMNVFQIDEIRLDNTWAGVTPLATPAPGPIYGVSGGGVGCPGDVFPIIVSGSVATNQYMLFTNEIYAGVSLPGNADGSALNMGSYAAVGSYSVLATNPLTGYSGWMSNSPSILVRQAPAIVTEPIPAITATNNRAQFVVGATGDEIGFQWYKDGVALTNDAHLSGASSSALVIWPAAVADEGNYYCDITNPCSVAPLYTTTNSLALDAPSDLIWAGNAFNLENWDISTSFNWNSGSSVFNEGDNVTFDDSYPASQYGAIINLEGVLTPSMITYSTAQQLGFAGSGIIAGTGELLITGAGRLVISNTYGSYLSNPYSGGTVISNGAVYIQSWTSLGTGPITLAGGTLETKLKGNNGKGLNNTIYVTGNSVWQTDQPGEQSASLMAPLIGSAGTTMTFSNNSTSTHGPNWVYLNAALTNDSAIILSCMETNLTGEYLYMDPGSGAQVYNAPITEGSTNTGGVAMVGKGAAYLNAANDYSLGTLVSAGMLAGSGSINGSVTEGSSGTLGGGSQTSIGTFTVNGNVIMSGNVYVRVDKSQTQHNDEIAATGVITNSGAGVLTITNLNPSAPFVAGDTFQIFNSAVSNGLAMTVTGSEVIWSNNLALNGSVQVYSVIPNYSTNLSYSVNGSTLNISWPATHLGWILQQQTNALTVGISTNWVDIQGTATGTSLAVGINTNTPAAFYRLRHP